MYHEYCIFNKKFLHANILIKSTYIVSSNVVSNRCIVHNVYDFVNNGRYQTLKVTQYVKNIQKTRPHSNEINIILCLKNVHIISISYSIVC